MFFARKKAVKREVDPSNLLTKLEMEKLSPLQILELFSEEKKYLSEQYIRKFKKIEISTGGDDYNLTATYENCYFIITPNRFEIDIEIKLENKKESVLQIKKVYAPGGKFLFFKNNSVAISTNSSEINIKF